MLVGEADFRKYLADFTTSGSEKSEFWGEKRKAAEEWGAVLLAREPIFSKSPDAAWDEMFEMLARRRR